MTFHFILRALLLGTVSVLHLFTSAAIIDRAGPISIASWNLTVRSVWT